jgi:hypothetical protein
MTRTEQIGENLILVIIIAILFMELIVTLPLNLAVARYDLPIQAVRLVLTVILLVFLYKGRRWARWFCTFLFTIATVTAIAFAAALAASGGGFAFVSLLLLLALISLLSAVFLAFSSSIKAFLARQRGFPTAQFTQASDAENITQDARTGEKLVVTLISATLLLSACVIAWRSLPPGAGRLSTSVIGFLITCLLCFFLYRGREWARWICIVLFSISGIRGLIHLASFGISIQNPFLGIAFAAIAFYLFAAGVLVFSSSVRAYFAWRNVQRSPQHAMAQEDINQEITGPLDH